MLRQRPIRRFGCLGSIGVALLCCLLLYIGVDPLLNVFFGTLKPPTFPAYPAGQQTRQWVERRDWGTHRFAAFETTDDRDTVLAGFARSLGPDWRRDDFRHADSDPTRVQTWSYLTHCPDTLIDLHYATSATGASKVTIEMTQYSCRDGILVVIAMNLFPFFH